MHSDVLIVGAGSAGCVVAERLSADPTCQVTLVEAGPDASNAPTAAMIADGSVLPIGDASPLVRRFPTVLTERPVRAAQVVRGAVVGGSGAVNGGYFCRGLPDDFDGWGLPGWTWQDVLPHFRDVENDGDFGGPAHGRSGAIPVRRVGEMSYSTTKVVERACAAGYPWIPDLNDPSAAATGVGAVPLNIVDGVRAGPGSAVLLPALGRANLTVLTGTRVRHIQVSSGRATGVEADGPSGPMQLTADRVVLCAGAIETAQLLMVSGVGDEAVLAQAGIPVVAAAPVGMRCADHPEWVLPTDWVTSAGGPALEAILVTDADIEIRPYTGGFVAMVGDGAGDHPDWPHVGVALMRPRSRARITLTSADPTVPPVIEHRYDSEPGDVAALRRGTEIARDICALHRPGEPLWGTSQHLCASAPMGTDRDENAVLDAQCRVRGVSGLWVIDGSALPTITRRGPHATIVMLAHRAAEFVVGPAG